MENRADEISHCRHRNPDPDLWICWTAHHPAGPAQSEIQGRLLGDMAGFLSGRSPDDLCPHQGPGQPHRIIRRGTDKMVLAGVTDYRAARILPAHASDPRAALAGTPGDAVKVMLAHQPKSVFQAEAAGADFLICGHTHGGQYIPFNYMIPLDQPYVHGLNKHGRAQIYVSRGTGYWGPPIRIGAPSEITVLRLVCMKPSLPDTGSRIAGGR
jgi:hypothetical protein